MYESSLNRLLAGINALHREFDGVQEMCCCVRVFYFFNLALLGQ